MKRSGVRSVGTDRRGRCGGGEGRSGAGGIRRLPRMGLLVAGLAVVALAGLAVADTVYVASLTNGSLSRYDSANPAGTLTTLLPDGTLFSPAALALGPDGALYIGESGNSTTVGPQLRRFDVTTGTLSPEVVSLAAAGVFPASIVLKGNDLLVGRNPLYQNTGPVVKVSVGQSGSSFNYTVSDYTVGGNLASSPGLAIGPDGSLYVADQTYSFQTFAATGPVKKFDATGAYVGEVIANGASGLLGPTGLVISGSSLYTASIMNGNVLKTDLATLNTTSFASTGAPFGAGVMTMMQGDRLLVGSPAGDGAIYSFFADGSAGPTFASGLGQIGGIVAVPEPGSVTLAVTGAGLAAWCAWRRRRAGSRLRRP